MAQMSLKEKQDYDLLKEISLIERMLATEPKVGRRQLLYTEMWRKTDQLIYNGKEGAVTPAETLPLPAPDEDLKEKSTFYSKYRFKRSER